MKDNVEWDAHTLDSDELAHDRDRTAANHKPGQVSPSESWTNLRAPYGTAPKMILSQTFHQARAAPDLRGRHATGGIAPNQQIISEAL